MEKYRKSKAELSSKDEYRDRSRSPHRKQDSDSTRDKSSKRHRYEENIRRKRTKSRTSSTSSDEETSLNCKEVRKAPPPPLISKISMNLKSTSSSSGIKMKLSAPVKTAAPLQAKHSQVASAFNGDSDDEVEEMPAEARMRMRNIGKNTPTSSGPNSFGKTKQGFVDSKKMFEKKMQQMLKDMPE